MQIQSSYISGIITLSIQGRLDSSVARGFQQDAIAAIEAIQGDIKEIIIDALELEFISSMGLRVILMLRRKYKKIRITNCNTDIFNIFKMTGFTHMMNIERALHQISLDGLTAVSGYSDLYHLTDETMLKVFTEGTTKEEVERIVKLTKRALIMEIPTPMTFEIQTLPKSMDSVTTGIDGSIGLIYENITPTDIDATTLGNILRTIHEHIIEPDGIIPSAASRVREMIQRMKPYLGDDNTNRLKQIFSILPEGSCLLHGNLALDKIALCNDEPVIMDMAHLSYGNPVIELSYLYYSLPEDKKQDYFDELINAYYNLESTEIIERNKQNIITLSIVFEFTRLVMCGEPSAEEVETCRQQFEERITSHWDEILSVLHFKMDFNEEVRKLERKRFYTDSDVSIDWMAKKLGTNRHYVSDYFNKVLHTTFSDYINTRRLDYAIELLNSKRIPQSQIAYTVGFNNDHTFRRLFKQRFGCTPSQYGK